MKQDAKYSMSHLTNASSRNILVSKTENKVDKIKTADKDYLYKMGQTE
jgi:hypothetical protein